MQRLDATAVERQWDVRWRERQDGIAGIRTAIQIACDLADRAQLAGLAESRAAHSRDRQRDEYSGRDCRVGATPRPCRGGRDEHQEQKRQPDSRKRKNPLQSDEKNHGDEAEPDRLPANSDHEADRNENLNDERDAGKHA